MSDAWKALERDVANRLFGKRVLRGGDFGESDVDVVLEDFPSWKFDCKYRTQSWAHHRFIKEIRKKYCEDAHDLAILITRCKNEKCAPTVSMSLDDFASIVSALRAAKHELWEARDVVKNGILDD